MKFRNSLKPIRGCTSGDIADAFYVGGLMSNKYCQALVELRNKPAHELKEVGDQWRTPDNIFWGINTLFGPFVLDLFTDGDNAKCAAYYTAEDNALAHDWSERLAELKGAAFGNPPIQPRQSA